MKKRRVRHKTAPVTMVKKNYIKKMQYLINCMF